jgi:hypothetical protein
VQRVLKPGALAFVRKTSASRQPRGLRPLPEVRSGNTLATKRRRRNSLQWATSSKSLAGRRTALTVIAASGVLVLDAMTPLGLAVWLLQVALVWVATLWAADRRQIIAVAAVCAMFIVLGYWLSPTAGPMSWVDQSNVLLGLGTVAALTHSCLRRMATEEARRKAAEEVGQMVRIVSGLLPMCAWCRKIRNETGSWEQWETYIRSHSHVEFTHGICQECAGRFNP